MIKIDGRNKRRSKKVMVNVNCEYCGEKFQVADFKIKNGRGKFCSRQCFYDSMKKKEQAICAWCGKVFEVWPSRQKERMYCSRDCFNAKHASEIVRTKCEVCGKIIKHSASKHRKYCSEECRLNSKVEYICTYCGKLFTVKKSRSERGNVQYCSIECYSKDRIKQGNMATKCANCDKPIYVQKCKYVNAKNNFCSRKCVYEYFVGERCSAFGKVPSHLTGVGRGGKRKDVGHYVRSTWEANYARILIYKGTPYQYEPKTFVLIKEDGSEATYTPDFFIGYWVEIKGWWREGDKEKVRLFREQYPEEKLDIVGEHEYRALEKKYKPLIKNWE
jgi:uncharacterized Zn-finger protein